MFKNLLASWARFNLRASVQRLSEKLGQRTFDSTTIKFAFNEISEVNKIFKIRESNRYADLSEFLNDLDYEIMQKVFNEMIKEQFE